jgi:hypothetical protein
MLNGMVLLDIEYGCTLSLVCTTPKLHNLQHVKRFFCARSSTITGARKLWQSYNVPSNSFIAFQAQTHCHLLVVDGNVRVLSGRGPGKGLLGRGRKLILAFLQGCWLDTDDCTIDVRYLDSDCWGRMPPNTYCSIVTGPWIFLKQGV